MGYPSTTPETALNNGIFDLVRFTSAAAARLAPFYPVTNDSGDAGGGGHVGPVDTGDWPDSHARYRGPDLDRCSGVAAAQSSLGLGLAPGVWADTDLHRSGAVAAAIDSLIQGE